MATGIYPEGQGKWRVRIWHKGQKQDWVIEGSKKDAELFQARKRVEAEQTGGLKETRVAPKFSAFCSEQYAPYAATHLKARTATNRAYTLRTLIEFFGDDKLTEITTSRVIAYQQVRLRQHIQPSTVNDEVKVLRAVLNYALYVGVPAAKLVVKDLPVRRKSRLKYWNDEEVGALLAAVAKFSPSLYWLVLFLLETGCRRGEAIALQFQDVDLERGIVRIQPNEEWQPKDNEAREIPLDKESVLYAWLKDEQTSNRKFVFVSRKKDAHGHFTPFMFWPQRKFDRARMAAGFDSKCSECLKATEVAIARSKRKAANRGDAKVVACSKHGLTGGPHTTRHTFATHFLAREPDLYLLGRILGHSHERVTKLYAHLLPEHLERARGAVSFKAPVGVAEMKARARWTENDDE